MTKRTAPSRTVFCALASAVAAGAATTMTGCEQQPPTDVQVQQSALSAQATAAYGFESLQSWTISSGSPSLGTPQTQGQSALTLQSPVNYTTITSAALAMTAADLAPLTQAGGYVAIDVALPTTQPNPQWYGSSQMYVSCPERGVYNQYLGENALTGRPLGSYFTLRFAVPTFVRQQLAGQSCAAFTLTFVLNVPSSGTGLYRVDNLRLRGAADPGGPGSGPPGESLDLVATRTASPPSSTPGTGTLASVRHIQIPESFHVAKGSAGTGQLTLALSGGGSTITCTYAGAQQGKAYDFQSCTGGLQPGALPLATTATLTIVSSDGAAGDTKVKAQLAVDPTGDELVTGLVPIPTFWGDTVAEMSTISAAYFNRVAAQSPVHGARVALPVPALGRGTGTVRTRDLLDPNAPPLSPLDPPFSKEGDIGGSDLANGVWRLTGFVDGSQSGDRFVTHVEAAATVGAVILGQKADVLRAQVVYDSDSGAITPTGRVGGSRVGQADVLVFGGTVASLPLSDSVTRTTLYQNTVGFSFPVFSIAVFSVNVGVSASLGVDLESQASADGLALGIIPNAVVRGSVSGDVNIVVASGGVGASIELVNVSLPVNLVTAWGINTNPDVCSAAINFVVVSDATVSVGAGAVKGYITFGNCSFFGLCHTEDWTLATLPPLFTTTVEMARINEAPAAIPLPRVLCDQPFEMAIGCGADNEAVVSGLPTSFRSTANVPPGQVPPTPGIPLPLPTPIPCAQRIWTTSDPSDQIIEAGCQPIIRFGNPGPRTLTMTASNGFQTATVSKPLTVVAATGTAPYARILQPVQGCLYGFRGTKSETLRASAIDPDGQLPITYSWDYTPEGALVPVPIGTGETLTWTPPDVQSLNATLRVTATDASGASVSAITPIFIRTVF